MRQLMAALGTDIKASGKDWIARCPVHQDKDFAMKISVRADSSVGAYCFACGANGLDLYKHLQLDLDELFGGKKQDKSYCPQKVQDEYFVDQFAVKIFEASEAKGDKASWSDRKRYKLAVARIKGVKEKYDI
jgi:hypothetical protein